MAATAITTTKLTTMNTYAAFPATEALDATDGALITPVVDHRTLIIVENSDSANAEDVTIVKGTQYNAAANNMVVNFAKSTTKCIVLDTAKYMNDDGKIQIKGSADVKVAAIAIL